MVSWSLVTSCEHTGGNALQGRHIPFTGNSRDQFAIRQAKSWERCHTQGSKRVGAVPPRLPCDHPLIGLQDGRRLCDEAEAGSPAAELRRARRLIVIAGRNSQRREQDGVGLRFVDARHDCLPDTHRPVWRQERGDAVGVCAPRAERFLVAPAKREICRPCLCGFVGPAFAGFLRDR